MSDQSRPRIGQRKASDIHELAKVLVRVHELDGYPVEGVTDPEAWLTPPREIAAWTASLDDRPVGHVSLTEATLEDDAVQVCIGETHGSPDDVAVVVRLFVDPAHRGRGVGQELMRAAYEHATSMGKHLVFDVMLKDQSAIRLYEAFGCRRLGVINHRHSDGLEEPAAVYITPQRLDPGRS